MSGLNNGSSGLFSGESGLVIATQSGLYNSWEGLGGGGGVVYSPEALALFARMVPEPDEARKGLINTAILALLTGPVSGANIWVKLDALYLLAAHSQQASTLNWKGASYTITLGGGMGTTSPDFTTDRGYLGDGVGKFLDTNFADNTAAVNWSQDSASLGVWVNQDNGATIPVAGVTASANTRLNPNSAGTVNARIHGTVQATTTGGVNRLGLLVGVRVSSSTVNLYRGGVSIATTGASTSAGPVSGTLRILQSSVGTTNDRVAAGVIAGALTANENLDLYNAMSGYLTGVGGA
jgi:hypothetical protein